MLYPIIVLNNSGFVYESLCSNICVGLYIHRIGKLAGNSLFEYRLFLVVSMDLHTVYCIEGYVLIYLLWLLCFMSVKLRQ